MGVPRRSFTDIDSGMSEVVAEALKEPRSSSSFINCLVGRCMTGSNSDEIMMWIHCKRWTRAGVVSGLLCLRPEQDWQLS